jgi:hypothetical protein
MAKLYNLLKNFLRPWKNPIHYSLLLILKIWGSNKVLTGPFKGLKFKQKFPPKPMLVGVWEKELSSILESIGEQKFIIDVGAAEGFYAVGLAKKYPEKNIIAFEMNPQTKELLENVAKSNFVSNIEFHGKCEYKKLANLGKKLSNSFIIMDCEGYEVELLKTDEPSIFKQSHILVELHEMYAYDCTNILLKRFEKTHQISEIKGRLRTLKDWPTELKLLKHLYPKKLILHYMDEGRPYPMNWLYMEPKIS